MRPPTPPRVENDELYWTEPPPEPSARLIYWVARIRAGWKENRRLGMMGTGEATDFFGVYIYEYLYVIAPMLDTRRTLDRDLLTKAEARP